MGVETLLTNAGARRTLRRLGRCLSYVELELSAVLPDNDLQKKLFIFTVCSSLVFRRSCG